MTKLRVAGLVALVLAIVSWVLENTFYGDIGADGVLRESFFLPLSFILAALGSGLLVASFFFPGASLMRYRDSRL